MQKQIIQKLKMLLLMEFILLYIVKFNSIEESSQNFLFMIFELKALVPFEQNLFHIPNLQYLQV